MARRMNAVYPRAIGLVERGLVEVDWLTTHRYPLDQVGEAFTVAAARTGLKVVVEPERRRAPALRQAHVSNTRTSICSRSRTP